jgi:hypothetical protein
MEITQVLSHLLVWEPMRTMEIMAMTMDISKGVDLREKEPMKIYNQKQADAALESDIVADVREGIEWIASNTPGVSKNYTADYKAGYLQSLVASLNAKINFKQQEIDTLKEENDKAVQLREIGDQVQQIYDSL